jgi:deazaflavin-dependent oxidoreductase (nitroreductase family)
VTDVRKYTDRRQLRLTTRGRKSGSPRTVTVWFVIADEAKLFVQHASRAPAQWYRNLLREPAVQVDFGDGPLEAMAEPILDEKEIRRVLKLVRRKYRSAWLIQLLGRKAEPVAAEIQLRSRAGAAKG